MVENSSLFARIEITIRRHLDSFKHSYHVLYSVTIICTVLFVLIVHYCKKLNYRAQIRHHVIAYEYLSRFDQKRQETTRKEVYHFILALYLGLHTDGKISFLMLYKYKSYVGFHVY